jgi:hypothetical protein
VIGLADAVDTTVNVTFSSEYVGVVENTKDPQRNGRLQIRVPDLHGNIGSKELPWAVPASPFGGGAEYGMVFIPPVGSKVKIRLWRGHPWFLEWYGTHWFKDEMPEEFRLEDPKNYGFKTPGGHCLEFCDDNGDDGRYIKIKTKDGHSIELCDDTGEDDNPTKFIKITDVNGDYVEIDSVIRMITVSMDDENVKVMAGVNGVDVKSKLPISIKSEASVEIAGPTQNLKLS